MTKTGPRTLGSRWPQTIRAGCTPMTRAAWMYSLLRSTRVEPRTVRAYCTQADNAIARTSTYSAISPCTSRGKTLRATPSISSAIRIAGKLNCTSAIRMMTVSAMPPRQPAIRPSVTPRISDRITADSPTISDKRAPNRMAENTSRPWLSVPSGKLQLPPASQAGGLPASSSDRDARSSGSCGASHGASAAPAVIAATISAAATATGAWRKLHIRSLSTARRSHPAAAVAASGSATGGRLATDPQARVDDVVEKVDDEIDRDEEESDQHEVGRHHRDVGEGH